MKDTKRCIEWLAFYDRCGMEQHLEKMAEDGWMLEKLTPFFWQYHRISPARLHFTITYFEKASIYDRVLPAGQQAYLEYCQKEGWHLAANSAQFQVFYSEEEDPVPIETDAMLQVENVHSVMKRTQIPALFLVLFVAVMQLFMYLQQVFEYPETELANNLTLSILFLSSTAVLLCTEQICGYFLWHHEAKKAAALDGSFYEGGHCMWFQKFAIVLGVINALFLIYAIVASGRWLIGILAFIVLPAVVCIGLWTRNTLTQKGVSKRINIIVTFALITVLIFLLIAGIIFVGVVTAIRSPLTEEDARTKVPLVISDLVETDDTEYEIDYDRDHSFLLDRIEVEYNLEDYIDDEDVPQINYTLTKIKAAAIYDLCFDAILRKNQELELGGAAKYVLEKDTSLWGAEKVYCLYRGERSYYYYIVCWQDRISEVRFYWQPTDAEIVKAAKALKSY